ncbi:hypothetical protein ACFOYU_12845 [Microvirga sp. GCM10011540]|uniref:hypothetical protein n=1 Tax=Microvirga sp. GCM10011540 TaxID=3317338 RepID=UPI0036149FDD
MSSSRKQAANQRNAQRSTGPRTSAGKSRARLNAFKHGLAIPAGALSEFASEVAQVAHAIIGEAASDPVLGAAAARVAEASIDVLRARRAKTALLERLTHDPALQSTPAELPLPVTPARPRYSRAAHAQAIRDGTEEQWLDAYFAAKAAGANQRKQAKQQASLWDQLSKLDRYERRALSRRDRAIQAFDEACATACHLPARPSALVWQNEPKTL